MSVDSRTLETLLARERGKSFRHWRRASWCDLAFRHLMRAVRATTRASALLFTLVGVAISILGLALTGDGRLGWALLLVALLAAFLVSGFLVLKMLPPRASAGLLIRGRKTGEILQVCALHILGLASAFNHATKGVDALCRGLLDDINRGAADTGTAARARRILAAEEAADTIDNLYRSRDLDFRRIRALKHVAAAELGISRRSFGDHILQFSPDMFRAGVDKYLRNLQEMVGLARAEDFEAADRSRFEGLIEQNRRLEEDCHRRETIAQLLLRFEDLHQPICALASTRSTSSSLQAYSRALADLAARQQQRFAIHGSEVRGAWIEEKETAAYIDTYERFIFLCRRQRAHPGFDLHSLLRSAVDRMTAPEMKEHFRQDVVHHLASALRAIDWRRGRQIKVAPVSILDHDSERRQRVLRRMHLWLGSMAQIHRYFNRLVSLSRDEMAKEFRRVLKAWFGNLSSDEKAYVLTLGYSKTVREMIRIDWPLPDHPPCFYQLLRGDKEEFEARLMTWELRGSLNRWRTTTVTGEGDMLASMVRPGDRVLVLLGAEAVDADRRVLHPKAGFRQFEDTLARISKRGVRTLVVVAAESYKHHSEPFAKGNWLERRFERIGFYGPESSDLVISDQGSKPKVSEVLLSSRRAEAN